MTNDQFEREYYPKYAKTIRGIARKLARSNSMLFDDLEAVGQKKLWEFDLSIPQTNEDSYIRTAIRGAMVDEVRRQYPLRAGKPMFESLDAQLDAGTQVDGVTGTIYDAPKTARGGGPRCDWTSAAEERAARRLEDADGE